MKIDDWLIQIDETLSLIKIIKIIVLWKDSINTTNIIMLRIDIIINMFEKSMKYYYYCDYYYSNNYD